MGNNIFKTTMEDYLENRQPVNARCMQGRGPDKETLFCSKLIMTDEPECYCSAYTYPDAKWKNGDCPLADTFLKEVEVKEGEKKRIGQQKSKKKSRR